MKPPQVSTRRKNAEEKIKAAARKLFTKKGYAATKTRDIAAEAGINLALLNYYFHSKDELFNVIMLENYSRFLRGMSSILNDEKTTLDEKVENLVAAEIDMLTQQPDLPIFMFNQISTNTNEFIKHFQIDKLFKNSVIMKQIIQNFDMKKNASFPLHLFINLAVLTVAPFVVAPALHKLTGLNQMQFNKLMAERKKMIPIWFKTMKQRPAR